MLSDQEAYAQELFKLMLTYIDDYKNNKISGYYLVDQLLVVIDEIEDINLNNSEGLFSTCINLESSFVMYEEEAKTEEEKNKERDYIEQYLNELTILIHSKIL